MGVILEKNVVVYGEELKELPQIFEIALWPQYDFLVRAEE
jgi:hypothetical protein